MVLLPASCGPLSSAFISETLVCPPTGVKSKSAWQILLHEAVIAEVSAHTKRRFRDEIETVQGALLRAGKTGIIDLPQLDTQTALRDTLTRWERNVWSFFDGRTAIVLPIGNDTTAEAVRRATERIAPCTAKGEGMRDAIIWLDLLAASRPNGKYPRIAFVSLNTGDFAAPDKISLRRELSDDVTSHNALLTYYTGLNAFLEEQARRSDQLPS